MKVRVTKSFIDRYTKETYKKGAELEITKERFAEINEVAGGLIETIEEVPEIVADPKKRSKKAKED